MQCGDYRDMNGIQQTQEMIAGCPAIDAKLVLNTEHIKPATVDEIGN